MNHESFLPPRVVAALVGIAFVSGIVGGSLTALYFTNGSQGVVQSPKVVEEHSYVEESQSIDAIKKVSPAVVSIVATQDLKYYRTQPFPFYQFFNNDPFGDMEPGFHFSVPQQNSQFQGQGQEGKDYEIQKRKVAGGSGFIISPEGMVLTNRHVVLNKDVQYSVITNDGTEYDAEVVSIDPLNDLAVLQMIKKGEIEKAKAQRTKLTNLPVVEIGDSDALQVGQKVLAIGYALGEYENTVTAGIISAKGREITADDGQNESETLSGLLQTDTAINPGNSGGPLINLAGQVIGINVAINAAGSNIGFAIPMKEVKPVLESISKYGRIVRPNIGVRHKLLDKTLAAQLKIPVDHGALLVGDEAKGEFAVLPGSPADKAGLKIRDVILSVDGKDITTDYTLQDSIRDRKPGDAITLKVWRSGQTLTIKLTLGEAKDEAADLRAKV